MLGLFQLKSWSGMTLSKWEGGNVTKMVRSGGKKVVEGQNRFKMLGGLRKW